MLGGADNPNGELPSYITGADTSLGPQIITAVSTIASAVGAVFLTHHFTLRREERTAAAKLASERLYISTELVFLLALLQNAEAWPLRSARITSIPLMVA